MDIVLKLRELRRLRGLSQKNVAHLSGVGEKTVSSFETGERVDAMKVSQLRKLLRVYNITEEQFFSPKMDQWFDADARIERSREESLVVRLGELPPLMRDALLERFELMLQAAELAAASQPGRAPVPPAARPSASSRLYAVA
ncbi:MAG: Helix-turn-helix domain [Thermoanaerobaculia bacterium]|jgi:transcriptional regulator with XRE-family HTH domain|nr:Helix-turn-helix domain [Thermoanaerobaculia bacterium]